MRRPGLMVAIAVLGAGWLAWWLLRPAAAPPPQHPTEVATSGPSTQPAPTEVPVPAAPAPRPAPSPATQRTPPAPSPRIELPPPHREAPTSAFSVPAPRSQPIDRRPNPGPHAASEREQLGYALETLDEDIEACLAEWGKSQVAVSGEVMLAIQIDAQGIQKAWVQREGDVPLGPRSCFANAAYGIDWSHMVESPAEITRRYELPTDGGS